MRESEGLSKTMLLEVNHYKSGLEVKPVKEEEDWEEEEEDEEDFEDEE